MNYAYCHNRIATRHGGCRKFLRRTRATSKPPQTFIWSPTGMPRHFEPTRFGRLRFRQNEN